MIIAGREVVDWVEKELGETFTNAAGIGLVRKGEIVAGVVYESFSRNSCAMHVASKKNYWFTKEFANAAFGVPFVQWDYERVTAPIYSENEQARRFVEKIGFVHEGTLRGTRPVCIYGLLKSESRWHHG